MPEERTKEEKKMGRKKKILCGLGCLLLLTGAFATGHYAGAASKTPGSTEDPLITLSYLEGRLASRETVSEKVQLSKGKKLVCDEGTTLVVLGGSVVANGDGLVDLTQGSLTEENTSMFLYHNYIVTENRGGCEALSSCTVFVSGGYTIK